MRLHQVAVQGQGALIGQRGVGGLTGVLARDAEIIPGLRVRGHQRRRQFQFLHRVGIIALNEELFAFQQRARPWRPAAGEENSERQKNGYAAPGYDFLWPASVLVVASTP